jgi:hypothetical protein
LTGAITIGYTEPSVKEWAVVVLGTDTLHPLLKDAPLPVGTVASNIVGQYWWAAHSAALREGVRRADAQGLRKKEPYYERALINFVLYDVLEPGDQCASGNELFCATTLPIFLKAGAFGIYGTEEYPAQQYQLQRIGVLFSPIYLFWAANDGRRPNSEIHLQDDSAPGPKDVWNVFTAK